MLDASHPKFAEEMALIASVNAHAKALKHTPPSDMLPVAKRLVQLLEALRELHTQALRPFGDPIAEAENADSHLPR